MNLLHNKTIGFLCLSMLCVLQLKAQKNLYDIDWDKIELAGKEAKILTSVNSQPGQDQKLITQTFDTKEGKITVYLPPLSFSATISGTVYIEPTGKDSSRNLIALQAYRLRLGDLIIPVQRGSFQVKLPTNSGSEIISLQLTTSTGQLIKTEQLPVITTSAYHGGFIIPPYIVSGDQAIITGNFDGDMTNTSIMIGGEKIELLAESSSRLYFKSPAYYADNVTVECNEKGNTQTSKTNILKLYLSVDNASLRRGQQTQFHIKIRGLEGLEEKVPVTISNTSPSIITLEGGNEQRVTVLPQSDAASGAFEITRNIQSLKNGSFSVTVTIIPYSTTNPK